MLNNLLDDIHIVDFSTRLPGPLASFILQSLGAKVTKIENQLIRDNFIQEDSDEQFTQWYQSLNDTKDIKVLDFEKDLNQIKKTLQLSNLIIVPKNRFFKNFIEKLNIDPKPIIEIAGGRKNSEPLHDLNALAMTNSFKLHCNDSDTPPYLPIAGITFAQYIATTAIAMIRKAENKAQTQTICLYLSETSSLVLDALDVKIFDAQYKFLHNGLYPCYNLYKTKDGKTLALAAVEEKYWLNFVELFGLELNLIDRFDKTGKIQKMLKKTFAKFSSHEICSLTDNKHICLTINDN